MIETGKGTGELAAAITVQAFIDRHPFTMFQRSVLAVCFLVVALDGFDTAVVGFLAASLRSEWGSGSAELTPLMMAGLVGLMFGAFVFGPLADRYGRKKVLLVTTFVFGSMCLTSGMARSLAGLTIMRFLTGVGLGGAMPNAIALSSEFCPAPRRGFLMTLMFCGFTIGMASAGFVANEVIPSLGWRAVLVLGGVVPLLLLVPMALFLPESPQFLVQQDRPAAEVIAVLRRISPVGEMISGGFRAEARPDAGPVSELFSPVYARSTVAIWLTYFMGLLVIYLISNWLPLLLGDHGMSPRMASLTTIGFHVGGTIGALVLGLGIDRWDGRKVLAAGYGVGTLAFATIALIDAPQVMIGLMVIVGGVISGGQVALNVLTASVYPTSARATGLSWANGVGRAGSIAGSAVGGSLLASGLGVAGIIGLLAVPAALCAAGVMASRPRAMDIVKGL